MLADCCVVQVRRNILHQEFFGGGVDRCGVTHVVDGTCPGNAPVQPARGWWAWGGSAHTQRAERATHCRRSARGQVSGT